MDTYPFTCSIVQDLNYPEHVTFCILFTLICSGRYYTFTCHLVHREKITCLVLLRWMDRFFLLFHSSHSSPRSLYWQSPFSSLITLFQLSVPPFLYSYSSHAVSNEAFTLLPVPPSMPPPHTHITLTSCTVLVYAILTFLHTTPGDMQSITLDERLFLPHQCLRISC